MTLTDLIILGLATWRVSSLLTKEPGPHDMFQKLREAVGIQHDENGDIYLVPDGFWPGVLSCILCNSIWVAAWFYLCYRVNSETTLGVCSLLALSTVAILVDRHT